MDKRLLDILCCPTTRSGLRMMAEPELAALNQAILANGVVSGSGIRISTPVASGLITQDTRTIYRIEDDIPVMLADEAIATAQITHFPQV